MSVCLSVVQLLLRFIYLRARPVQTNLIVIFAVIPGTYVSLSRARLKNHVHAENNLVYKSVNRRYRCPYRYRISLLFFYLLLAGNNARFL